jgi:hypothetical protein
MFSATSFQLELCLLQNLIPNKRLKMRTLVHLCGGGGKIVSTLTSYLTNPDTRQAIKNANIDPFGGTQIILL